MAIPVKVEMTCWFSKDLKQFHVSCFYSLLFIITLQKFKNELKKNREKILGDAESSSKTKKKEVHI